MIFRLVGFFVVLGFLIFVHELGHYLAARLARVKVEEFGMGYPPRLAKLFTFQGTDFTLNWIPYGGFARLKGTDEDDPAPDSFGSATQWRKSLILVAGAAMNFLLAIVCFAVTYTTGVPVDTGMPELRDVPAGTLAAEYRLRPGDIILSVNGVSADVPAYANYVRLREPAEPALEATSGVIALRREGETVQLPAGDLESIRHLLEDVPYQLVLGTRITAVADDSPALAAGIQPGDRVFALADQTIYGGGSSLVEVTRQHLGTEVSLVLLREDGQWVSTRVTPRQDPPENQGAMGIRIASASRIGSVQVARAMLLGVADTIGYVWATLSLPAQMIRGQVQSQDATFIGPIGIASMVGDAIEATSSTGIWLPILRLSGALSAALAIINLLPLPALDGGRLMFVIVEAIRRKRVEPSHERVVHMVGMAVLLLAMVLITIQDLTTPHQPIDWYGILGE